MRDAIDEILIGRQGETIIGLGYSRGGLIDIAREPVDRALAPGAIHRARVGQAVSGGVFVDLASGKAALLDTEKPPPPGTPLIVQIVEAPQGGKRARVSRRVALEGNFLVLLPGGKGISVSKRISAAKREIQQARAHALAVSGEGLILRGTALEADDSELAAELSVLRARAAEFGLDGAPALLWSENAIAALRRALGVSDDVPVLCADADLARAANVAHDPAAFDRHDAGTTLARLEDPRVDLRSGAWLSIEPTAALIAIDVNAGRAKGDALAIDIDAVREIARQLRLRDLSGLVLVDILRIVKPGERARLLDAFKHAVRDDRRRVDVLGFTPAGLIELTRARARGNAGE